MENKPNRVIIHHTADDAEWQSRKVNDYHRDVKKFSESALGYFSGYHYLIEKSGLIFNFRLESETGEHDTDENINSLGVALAGNFNEKLPTPAQETALSSLLEGIMARHKMPISRIEPHRWGDTTECPGKLLPDHWAQIVYIKHKLSWIQKLILSLSKRANL